MYYFCKSLYELVWVQQKEKGMAVSACKPLATCWEYALILRHWLNRRHMETHQYNVVISHF